MFEDIRNNKIKSGFIVCGFIIIISLIIYFLCIAFKLDAPIAIGFALIFSGLISLGSYYNSDKIILAVTKARPATIEEDKKVIHILEALMLSSRINSSAKTIYCR